MEKLIDIKVSDLVYGVGEALTNILQIFNQHFIDGQNASMKFEILLSHFLTVLAQVAKIVMCMVSIQSSV